jgi:hypothetical protein
MKLKNRRDDSSAPETAEWAKMNDWFAELRDDRPAGPGRHGLAEPSRDALADDDLAQPARHSLAEPARHSLADDNLAEPAPDGRRRPETAAAAPPAGRPALGAGISARAEVIPRAEKPQRAPIGDQLRLPAAWCEMGSCIGRHADPAALGEVDARARAISAGWRVDALGRLACPRCLQTSPGFRTSLPVTLWDRDTALASATLTIAVTRHRRAAGHPGRPAAGVIPAGPPAAISRQPAPGTAPETPWPPPPPAGRPAQQYAIPAPRHRRREAPTGQQVMGVLAEAS